MTARLVALMSAVLFLSLLAFSLLLNHSRAAVLAEVENTVRTVGSQTLTAMFGTDGDKPMRGDFAVLNDFASLHPGGVAPWLPAGWHAAPETSPGTKPGIPIELVETKLRAVVIAHDDPRTVHHGEEEIEVTIGFLSTYSGPNFDLRVKDEGAPPLELDGRIVPDAPVQPSAPIVPVADTNEGTSPLPATAHRAQRVFRVAVDEYAKVFDAIGERMIWLFAGVFLLGIALSTALARRFTRPIRDLDEALQRVTAGDLDVAVAPAGGPEVGRLAVAFNTMTQELRKNRDRERELIRREKMSALGRLAAGVAHDVRNPLHSIGLTLQNLEEACRPAADEQRGVFERAVGLIRREVKRLDSLVSGFLSFARSDPAAHHTVRLPELVRETAALVAKESERRGITVVVDAEPELAPIAATPGSLRSAILNLVLNAFEATPRGGTVTLRVTAESGNQVIEVGDTGKGIPEADRERVFEFGFTTREGGTGLGLAMVHHTIVEEHSGRIAIESEEGKGTRVRLVLPAPGVTA